MEKFLMDHLSFCDLDGVNFMTFVTNSLDFSPMKSVKCFQVRDTAFENISKSRIFPKITLKLCRIIAFFGAKIQINDTCSVVFKHCVRYRNAMSRT